MWTFRCLPRWSFRQASPSYLSFMCVFYPLSIRCTFMSINLILISRICVEGLDLLGANARVQRRFEGYYLERFPLSECSSQFGSPHLSEYVSHIYLQVTNTMVSPCIQHLHPKLEQKKLFWSSFTSSYSRLSRMACTFIWQAILLCLDVGLRGTFLGKNLCTRAQETSISEDPSWQAFRLFLSCLQFLWDFPQ